MYYGTIGTVNNYVYFAVLKLFRELDKGIDDMEKGNTMSHEDSMKQIRERLKKYAV